MWLSTSGLFLIGAILELRPGRPYYLPNSGGAVRHCTGCVILILFWFFASGVFQIYDTFRGFRCDSPASGLGITRRARCWTSAVIPLGISSVFVALASAAFLFLAMGDVSDHEKLKTIEKFLWLVEDLDMGDAYLRTCLALYGLGQLIYAVFVAFVIREIGKMKAFVEKKEHAEAQR